MKQKADWIALVQRANESVSDSDRLVGIVHRSMRKVGNQGGTERDGGGGSTRQQSKSGHKRNKEMGCWTREG